MNLSINRGLIGLASCCCLVYEGLAPLKRLLNPSGFEGLKSPPSKPQRLGDKNFQKHIYAFKGLVYQGFQGFQGNQKRFQRFLILMRLMVLIMFQRVFSQVVKVSRAGHTTSHTSMSKLSKTLQSSKCTPQGPKFSTGFELKAHILERLHLSVHLRIAFLLVAV